MSNSMKQFITRKLKENVPLAEIKKDLKEKGYALDEINMAVREAISSVGIRKLHPTVVIQIGVLVVGVVIAVGVGFYLTDNTIGQNTTSKSNVQSFAVFCDKFKEANYKISCNDAVQIALVHASGVVQNVSIDRVNTFNASTEPPSRIAVDMWLVDVKVDTPYFDETFKKEVRLMRIGIGLNENFGIYKEVIA